MVIFLYLGGVGFFELLFAIIFILTPMFVWIWAIIDLLKSKFASDANKLIWALVVVFLPFLGTVLYLTIGRKQRLVS